MAYRVDIMVDKGSEIPTILEFFDHDRRPISFDGFTALMQVRRTPTSETIIDELSSEGDSPRLKFCADTIRISWPRGITQAITAGRYVYDIQLTQPNGSTVRLVEGALVFRQEVTR